MSSAMTERRPTRPAESGSLRVLVGDDQMDVLEALRLLLKGRGIRRYWSILRRLCYGLRKRSRSTSF